MQINPEIILWIIIWWLIAWLMFFLTVWLIESKTKAKSKLGGTAFAALIAVVIIPLLRDVEAIGAPLLYGIGPYIAFFITILLIKGLATEQWSNAVIVSFVGIIFLVIIYNLVVNVMNVTSAWELFVA